MILPGRSTSDDFEGANDVILSERTPSHCSKKIKQGCANGVETSSDFMHPDVLIEIDVALLDVLRKLQVYMDQNKNTGTHVDLCVRTAHTLLQNLKISLGIQHSFADSEASFSSPATESKMLSPSGQYCSACEGENDEIAARPELERSQSTYSLVYDTVHTTACAENLGKAMEEEEADKAKVKRVSLSTRREEAEESDEVETPAHVNLMSDSRSCHSKEVVTSTNKCYLHPERPFRLCWDATSLCLILIVSVLVPLELAFYWDSNPPVSFGVVSLIVDFFFGFDIILNFGTAYHDGHGVSGQLVTGFRGIALHYARGWFLVDVLATFPYIYAVEVLGGSGADEASGAEASKMLRMLKYAKIARVMKVLRVLKLGGLMQAVEEKMVAAQSMTVAFQLSKMTIVMFILSHNVACIWFGLANQSGQETSWLMSQDLVESSGFSQWVAAFYFAITTGTTVGYGDIHPENTVEQAVTAFLLVVSVGYIGQFLGRVSQMVNSLRQHENEKVQSKRDALIFMSKRHVPKGLQFKVLRYIEHTFETHAVTALDTKIMNHLSESLQSELALTITGNVYRQFPLFEDLDDEFLTSLCAVGRTKRAGTGDLVAAEETAAHEMFWVVRGEAMVTRRGVLINILRRDDWFGELALFFPGAVRTATVRCETNCEFLVLNHDDFHKQTCEFPHVKKQFDKLGRELRQGDPKGLKLRCLSCGSREHLTRDCPMCPFNLDYERKKEADRKNSE